MFRLTFVGGKTYAYEGVPVPLCRSFLAAESYGRFFNTHIRDRYPLSARESSSAAWRSAPTFFFPPTGHPRELFPPVPPRPHFRNFSNPFPLSDVKRAGNNFPAP